MKYITKELFLETMNVIQTQYEKDWENSNKLTEVFESFVEPYNNGLVTNQLVKLLHNNFNIKSNKHGTDIEYFMWDLDFGKGYTEGCYKVYGENISLATAEDLWNHLNTKYKKK
jgi:hypothetical protein